MTEEYQSNIHGKLMPACARSLQSDCRGGWGACPRVEGEHAPNTHSGLYSPRKNKIMQMETILSDDLMSCVLSFVGPGYTEHCMYM